MLLQLGEIPTLVVSSPEMARVVMRTHDHIFASRPLLKGFDILLYGAKDIAFTPYCEHWKQEKKLCTMHLLNTKKVESFKHVKEEEVRFAIAKIYKAQESSKPINLSKLLDDFANDTICRVVSGFSFRTRKLAKRWDDVLEYVIKEHSMNRDKNNRQESSDFVDVLLSLEDDLHMKYGLTKDHLKALLLDMFLGGTDTSYITLEWAIAELVKNLEAMKKLQEEVRRIAHGKEIVEAEDLIEMSYLSAVIKEVLRFHPPGPLLIARESMEDCQIEGYQISKRTRVIINAWAISRDPKYWEAAEEFHPERFIGSSVDYKGNDFQFIPFGAGRRICPGIGFGISTIELMLANLVYHFDWELPHGVVREEMNMTENPGLTTRMKESLYLVPKSYK
ncbi:indole-2-monooxygenase-like [Typha latifolia]|uniref:indole-2-monooxygenase-like n=1 Tax=Typha latifolia TaxID=4733 RepID=UPI003C2DC007